MHQVKTVRLADFKALDEGEGTFEAIVSVFGNVDYVGDRVVAGAFAKTLADWAESGDPIPVIWSHKWDDPDMHLGAVTEAAEVEQGLWVKGTLDLDAPVARQVFRLLKGRRVREFSFAYDVLDERKASDGANELLELALIEVGPTLRGANPATELLDVKAAPAEKAAQLKARVTAEGSYERLREQIEAALPAWAGETFPDLEVWTTVLEATYADHAVVYVETWSQPYGGGTFYSTPWSTGAAGIELGEATEVQITGVVVPKALAAAWAKKAAATERLADPDEVPAEPDPLVKADPAVGRWADAASVYAELDLIEAEHALTTDHP